MMDYSRTPTVFLMGPTASGKTGLSLALVRALRQGHGLWPDAELISVDSAQVFIGMDIGTAKPTPAERAEVVHHGIDLLDPAEIYSVSRFCADAQQKIAAVKQRGHLPILVGGTGLYYRSLEYGISDLPQADAVLRQHYVATAAAHGWPSLHAHLQTIDPDSAARIDPNDSQRIQRALEIYALTGKTRSDHFLRDKNPLLEGPLLKLALMPPERAVLHQRIALRFEQMLTAGFLDEVAALKARGDLHSELPSIRSVGYRQLWEHLDGQCSLPQAVDNAIAATRQYAKRQITWLRSEKSLHWLDPAATNLVDMALSLLHTPTL